MQPATGEGLCYNLKRNDNGNTDVDGGPRRRSDCGRGNEEQGAVWSGGVRRVQSKCWPDTWERLDPIVFYRCGGTDKQKDLNKSYSKKILYAGGLAVVEDGEPNLQEQLIKWKDIFSRHGLRLRLVKTEVMWVGFRRKEL